MLSKGDTAPDFTAMLAGNEPEPFSFSDHLDEAPLVLAFLPGAFSPDCTNEMATFQSDIDDLRASGATLYGISSDSPFSQAAFREEHGLEFDLLSDMSREAIDSYGLNIDLNDFGLYGIATRAVFVMDGDGEITFAWVADDPTNEPDYEAVYAAVEATA